MSTLLLGVDIGTSSCKTALFDPEGNVVAQGGCEYPVAYPRKGWAEQDPAAWWDGVCRAVREMTAENGINPAEMETFCVRRRSGRIPAARRSAG